VKAITPKDLIADDNANRAADEILNAFDHWRGNRTTGDLYEELGLGLKSPELTAWLRVFYDQSDMAGIDATEPGSIALLDGMANVGLFCLWLGSRIERMGKI